MARETKAAVEGWFTQGEGGPALLGTKCTECGSKFFPRETFACRNPECRSRDLEEVELGRRGRIWSFTDAQYQPPPPFVPRSDPFEPFVIAAVELTDDKMVVLGQMVPGTETADLSVGMEVELTVGTLFTDDEAEHLMWQWKPVDATEPGGA